MLTFLRHFSNYKRNIFWAFKSVMMDVCMTQTFFNTFVYVSAGSNYSCAVWNSFHLSLSLSVLSIQLEMSAEADVRKKHYSQLSISDDVFISLFHSIYSQTHTHTLYRSQLL